ncbi:MAG: ribosome biogenesis GTPase Der [Candidatus Omnitrophica bacterium]|nr:ribosome biogenesis GTPase Der [Candidatus Omnitrophota bacterium]
MGKSALFNRLIRRRQALVDATPGLTRDRLYADVSWSGMEFQFVDTGGLQFSRKEPMAEPIAAQVGRAMEEAAAALFVVDARDGPVPLDKQISSWVRRWGKPVLLVANKVDTGREAPAVPEFAELGLGPAHPVSALHGLGIGDLLDALIAQLKPAPGAELSSDSPPDRELQDAPSREVRVAFVGRPNVGKSSLVNRILGDERVLVDEEPGTTRDPVEARFSYRGRTYQLVDTAGIRAQRTLKSRMDAVARLKALEALRGADVCVGVLEAPLGIVGDDLRLLDEVVTAGRPLVLAVNKWDLLPRSAAPQATEQGIARRAPFVRFAPVVCVSAKTGFHLLPLLDKVAEVAGEADKRLTSQQRKRLLERLRGDPRAPAGVRNAQLIYLTQVGTAPPMFQLLARVKGPFRDSDIAYLEQVLRREHGFQGTPVRFRILEKRREPRPEKRREQRREKRRGGRR